MLHIEPKYFTRPFAEMVFIKKIKLCINKMADIEHLNKSYNLIFDFLSSNNNY